MEIQNASTTSSKSNQLGNVNTVRWESRNITTRPREIDDRKSEVMAFVVNADMKITANNFYIFNTGKGFPCLKYLFCVTEVQLGIYQEYVSKIQGYRWWMYRQDIERYR